MVPAGDDAQSLVGTTIAGKYFVQELLGRGGMGDVYKATLLGLDRPIALKLLAARGFRADPALGRRFEREAAASSRLRHPNTIEVVDFGAAEDGSLYLAMEFVPGRTLAQVIADEAPLSAASAAHLLAQVLAALSDAHARGIIHRDLKPANVMVDPLRDPAGFVKVVDFGIATLADGAAEADERLTGQGMVYGTPAYMSPEQIRGEPLDPRSDLYSAGVMLFEMLSGVLPFEAPTPMAVAARHLADRAPRLSERRPDVRVLPAVEALVARALEKDPARRPPSAGAMREELAAAIATASGRPRTPPARELPPTAPLSQLSAGSGPLARRRRRVGVAGVTGLVVAAAIGLALLFAGRGAGGAPTRAAGYPGAPTATAIRIPTAIPTPTPTAIPTPAATAAARLESRPPPPPRRTAPPVIRLERGELGSIPTPPAATGDGVLVLVATPWADVAVGGVGLGETPREVRVPAGRYTVRAVHPELGVREDRVVVGAGERKLWAARFEP